MRRFIVCLFLVVGFVVQGQAEDWSKVYRYVVDHNIVKLVNEEGICTGVVVKRDEVLTASHCLEKDKPEYIQDAFGVKTEMQVLGVDTDVDLALLGGSTTYRKPIKLATESLMVGMPVMSLGFSGRSIIPAMTAANIHLLPVLGGQFVEIDRPLQHGYSGGPLVNLNGELIGINVRTAFHEGLGYAVPLEYVKAFLGAYL